MGFASSTLLDSGFVTLLVFIFSGVMLMDGIAEPCQRDYDINALLGSIIGSCGVALSGSYGSGNGAFTLAAEYGAFAFGLTKTAMRCCFPQALLSHSFFFSSVRYPFIYLISQSLGAHSHMGTAFDSFEELSCCLTIQHTILSGVKVNKLPALSALAAACS